MRSGFRCLFRGSAGRLCVFITTVEDKKFAEEIVDDDHQDVREYLGEEILHVKQIDQQEHTAHIHHIRCGTRPDKQGEFPHRRFGGRRFAAENKELIGRESKQNGENPRGCVADDIDQGFAESRQEEQLIQRQLGDDVHHSGQHAEDNIADRFPVDEFWKPPQEPPK